MYIAYTLLYIKCFQVSDLFIVIDVHNIYYLINMYDLHFTGGWRDNKGTGKDFANRHVNRPNGT